MKSFVVFPTLVVAGALLFPAAAREAESTAPSRDPGATVIREKIRTVFRANLRAELELTDQQVAAVTPRLERLEADRVEIRRERLQIIRDLRRAVRDGGDDASIDGLLERLDRLGMRQEEVTRDALRDVDRSLSPRQKVELRFFVARFRQEIARRAAGGERGGRRGAFRGRADRRVF